MTMTPEEKRKYRPFCKVPTAVCIAHYNETTSDFENCVADALSSVPKPQTIVVVDDCSNERLAAGPRLESFQRGAEIEGINLIVTKTEKRSGAGPTKRRCAEIAIDNGAELLAIVDCHCRMPRHWLGEFVTAYRDLNFRDGVFCAAVQGIDYSQTRVISAGGRYAYRNIHPDVTWQEYPTASQLVHHCLPTDALLGGCYVIPKRVWEKTGGIAPYFIGYGLEEPDFSLRAFLCGFVCYRCCGVVIGHSFSRDMEGNHMNGANIAANTHAMCYVIFGKEIYDKIYRPFLPWNKEIKDIVDQIDCVHHEHQLRKVSVYQPCDLEWLCNYRIPTIVEQRAKEFDRKYRLGEKNSDRLQEKEELEEEVKGAFERRDQLEVIEVERIMNHHADVN